MQPFQVYAAAFAAAFIVTIISVPFVKKFAFQYHFIDTPNARKVHHKQMPRLGGISIVLGFTAGFLYLSPDSPYIPAFFAGAFIIVCTGMCDDKLELSAKAKLTAQIAAAVILVSSGILISYVNIPFIGSIDFNWMSYPITVLWIVGITNAINLIDGLDGLASGVSSIALFSLLIMAVSDEQSLAIALTVSLLGGTIGFLFFNVHPAEIFMGDSGSMFIGYTISVISIVGLFKSVTLFSLIIPIIILAVPIFDTLFAIIRRLLKRQKLSAPDQFHLHHRLMTLGFSHRSTVMIIYVISLFFGASAVVFSKSFMWGSLMISGLGIMMLQFIGELIGLLHQRKPIIDTIKRFMAMGHTLRSHK